ncbi:MAG: type II toxin-antitoxin system HipA family toxin [Myxococcales bacterium]|nr:type II toxin-antitoxin system HipA family toxin [Myxococcales bacterium]
MSAEALVAIYEGRVAATVEREGERLTLRYDDGWRRDGPFPLSLSMPLARATHDHAAVSAFLANLLPDNARILEAWGRRFQVSAERPFRLLAHVGEDCAGAFAFVRSERVDAFLRAKGRTTWLSDADVAARLAALRSDVGASRLPTDRGQFSLAGAQAKIALAWRDGRWGVPSGTAATTHILKPPIPELDGHVENEHFCLRLASNLGLTAARSEVAWFGDEVAVVVERFDRRHGAKKSEPVRRVHQEDLCQALGLRPDRKYQADGGPAPARVAELLRVASSEPERDVAAFADALLFAWLTGGTDAHAKNYALLHGAAGRLRLAPLYDLASALVYPGYEVRKLKLAMKLGGSYRLWDVGWRHVEKLAAELGIEAESTSARARALADALPDAARAVAAELGGEGVTHPIVERLVTALVGRASHATSRLRSKT